MNEKQLETIIKYLIIALIIFGSAYILTSIYLLTSLIK